MVFNDIDFPLLTDTTKMPGYSFSLPAHSFTRGGSCIGAVYGKNEDGYASICDSCYAGRGSYAMYPFVKRNQLARYEWTKKAVLDFTFVPIMIDAIETTSTTYFRWFDSGDFYSIKFLRAVEEICVALPQVKFWIPTRTWRFIPYLIELQRLNKLSNVSVRPSAIYMEGDVPEIPGLSMGTSVSKLYFNCPASKQNNQCGNCRSCWNGTSAITYKAH